MISRSIFSCMLIIALIFIANYSIAQEERCAPIYQEELILEKVAPYGSPEELTEYFPAGTRHIDVFVHIVRYSNGSGGISLSDVNTAMTQLNNAFNSLNTTNITFALTGNEYIDDDDFANIEDEPEAISLMLTNVVPAHINVYFVPSLYADGVAFTPGISLIVENGYATDDGTLTHEVGHNLYLFHTHEADMGIEHITRDGYPGCPANCSEAGDLLCDTPADPNLSIRVTANCQYNPLGNPSDPCGNTNYDPDVHNYMSYTRTTCMDNFTPQQINRMHWALTTNILLKELIETDVTMANRVNSNNVTGSTLEVNQTTVPSGSSITLLDGEEYTGKTNHERFEDYPGVGDVKHHDWNSQFQEYLLAENFIVDKSQPDPHRDANFEPMEPVTVKNNLLSTSGEDGGDIDFHDPWYADANNNQPNDFITWPSPHYPKGKSGETEGGVFLNQDPEFDPDIPNYSVRALQTQTIPFHGQNITWYFRGWEGDEVDFEDAEATETAVVFRDNNPLAEPEARAVYKGHLASSNSAATAHNNGRRVVRDGNGVYHAVYEDGDNIWYTWSNHQAATWAPEKLVSGGLEGTHNQYPSITEMDGILHVVWTSWYSEPGVDQRIIAYKAKAISQGTWGAYFDPILSDEDVSFIPKPAIETWRYHQYNKIMISFEKPAETESTIECYYKNVNEEPWQHLTPSFPGGSPSLCASQDKQFAPHIVYGLGNQIYSRKWNNSGNNWFNPVYISGQSGWVFWHQHPNISLRDNDAHFTWEAQDDAFANYVLYRESSLGELTAFPAGTTETPHPTVMVSPDIQAVYYQYNNMIVKRSGEGDYWFQETFGQGQYPNCLPHGTAGAIWTKYTSAPYRLDLDLNYPGTKISRGGGLSPGMDTLLVNKRFEYPFPAGRDSADAYLILEIQQPRLAGNHRPIRFSRRQLHTQPFRISPGAASLEYQLLCRFKNVNAPVDSNRVLFHLEFIENSTVHSLATLRLKQLLHLNNGQTHVLSKNLSLTHLANKRGYLKIRFGEQTPCLTNMVVEADSMRIRMALGKAGEEAGQMPATQIPGEYNLRPNYPNPFNPTTTITFSLPEDAPVHLQIYDITGRKVRTLADHPFPAGVHQLIWDGRDEHGIQVSSGIYVYRIEAGKFVESRKMVLMR